jgi:hypothetical protein
MLSQFFPNRIRSVSLVVVLCVVSMLVVPSSALSTASNPQESGPTIYTPIVESAHPYANGFNNFWTVEMPGAQATRIHFSRIELEDPADYLVISDPSDRRVQVITGAYPSGLWTDPVPGEFVKIRLVTDGTVRKWGFAVDQKEAVTYPSIVRSAYPYHNDTNESWTVYNTSPGNATRIHFSRIELEENVDWLILSDAQDNPYQYITGSYPSGMWSLGIPGIAVKMRLISDGSVENWGFNIDSVQSTTANNPVPFPDFPTVAESSHPSTAGDRTWTITNPNALASSTKVHFTRLQLDWEALEISDGNDNVIQRWNRPTNLSDFWSYSIPGPIVKIRLVNTNVATYGFRIDRVSNGEERDVWVESDHGSAVGQRTWTIINPDSNAVSTKVHFTNIQIDWESLIISDGDGTVIHKWSRPTSVSDFWSDYIPGRIVNVRFNSAVAGTWGFRIDKVINGENLRVWAQSDHPPSQGYREWTIINPNPTATQTRLHFSRIHLDWETLQILDGSNTVVQQWNRPTSLNDFWSADISGRIVKLRHSASGVGTWGFRVDDLYPSSTDPITPASIVGVYINVVHSGRIYLNNSEVAYAQEPGEYKILLPSLGEHVIRIEYTGSGYIQEIRATVSEDSGLSIIYLPLVQANR